MEISLSDPLKLTLKNTPTQGYAFITDLFKVLLILNILMGIETP